jgi:hypothetical protein
MASALPAVVDEPGNLVVNPSFEDDRSGWSPLWVRDDGAGETSIVASTSRAGEHALEVRYRGAHDWSFAQADRIAVRPGEVYALSGFTKLDNVRGNVELSVVTETSDHQVLEWLHGRKEASGTSDWRKIEGRFVVPRACATIRFRITGNGPGVAYFDALSLRRVKDAPFATNAVEIAITAGGTTLRWLPDADRLRIEGKPGEPVYTLAGLGTGAVSAPEKTSDTTMRVAIVDAEANGAWATASVDGKGDVVFTLRGEGAMGGDVEMPGPMLAERGQSWVLPINEGLLVPADDTRFPNWGWGFVLYGGHGLSMPFVGLTDGRAGLIAIAETQNDATARSYKPGALGKGTAGAWSFAWQPSKGTYAYERRLRVRRIAAGGYVAIAKAYREHARASGLVVTLKDKAAKNPNVDKLLGAIDLWYWQNAASWRRDPHGESQARKLKDAGIDRVLWSNEASKDTIEAIAALGYLPGRYDIVQDVYSPDTPIDWVSKEGWPDGLVLLASGDWMKGWVTRHEGKEYPGGVICSAYGLGILERRLAKDLAAHPYQARFLDTTTASPLRECYNPKHPETRSDDRVHKLEQLELLSNKRKLVTGSETGMDMAVPFVHYFEGMMSLGPYRLPDSGYDLVSYKKPQDDFMTFQVGPAYRIPLFELVYHDCVVSYWYWGDASNRIPEVWDARDRFNALYGTPPLWVMDEASWDRDKDRFVKSYKDGADVARRTGYLEMIEHRFLTDDHTVQMTRFADGTRVFANFGETPFKMDDGKPLAAKSHIVRPPRAKK